MHKGVWIAAENLDNQTHFETGIPSIAEAKYRVRRKYSLTPNLKHVTIFVGTEKLLTYNADEKGKIKMGRLSEYQATKAPASGNGHWATDDEKETLVAFDVPFWLVGTTIDKSPFTNNKTGEPVYYISYSVVLDTESDDYKLAVRKKQLDYNEMIIKLPQDADRLQDLEKMTQLGYLNEQEEDTKLKLVSFQPKEKSRKPYYKITDYDYEG